MIGRRRRVRFDPANPDLVVCESIEHRLDSRNVELPIFKHVQGIDLRSPRASPGLMPRADEVPRPGLQVRIRQEPIVIDLRNF